MKGIDKPLFYITILLFIIGLVMVFEASSVTAFMQHDTSPTNYFFKQAVFLIAGFFAFLFIRKISTNVITSVSFPFMLIAIASLGVLLAVGSAKNQAVSWFDLGFISIQPSEFIKVITIVWLARYYSKKKNLISYGKSLFPLFICGIVAGLIFIQPDLGTTIIYTSIVGLIFISVPIRKIIKFKTIFVVLGLVIIALLVILTTGKGPLLERQKQRLDFSKPCDSLETTGHQVCNCYIAINNGGLLGVGLGNSIQRYLYLPEPYTDFIFAIVLEELGALFGIFIVLLYMIVLYRILLIGKKSKTDRGAIICYGTAIYIFIHIVVNLMGIFGLMPMTGVPLPFMSYGGSFTLCLIVALSFVQRVSIENNMKEKAV